MARRARGFDGEDDQDITMPASAKRRWSFMETGKFWPYSCRILGIAFRNSLQRGLGMALSLIAAIMILALQTQTGIVPKSEGLLRFVVIVGPYVLLMLIVYLLYVWNAAWEHDKHRLVEIEVLRVQKEEYARLQAAHTLSRVCDRLAQALHSCVAEYPLRDDADFKKQYIAYLMLENDSYISIPRHDVDPMPMEQQTEYTREKIERALLIHRNWLRDYAARLSAELSARATMS
jgi:hypothetical protein